MLNFIFFIANIFILNFTHSQLLFGCRYEPVQEHELIEVIVIGGGPAGIHAAFNTARGGARTILITGTEPGGMLARAYQIENWPGMEPTSGAEIIERMFKQAAAHGVQFIEENACTIIPHSDGSFCVETELGTVIHGWTIIIATGGTEYIPSIAGLPHKIGTVVGICPICEGPTERNKDIVVIGVGEPAIDKASRLAHFARHVTLITPESELASFPRHFKEQLQTGKISLIFNSLLTDATYTPDGLLAHITCFNQINESYIDVPCQKLYVALATIPNTELVKNIVTCQSSGHIVLYNNRHMTSFPGIFAAGSVADAVYQKGQTATADGFEAACDALQHLRNLEKHLVPSPANHSDESRRIVLYEINSIQEFENFFRNNSALIVDFYITGCPACRRALPLIEEAARQLPNLTFIKVNYEKFPELVERFDIESVPTLVCIKDGVTHALIKQFVSGEQLKTEINNTFAG